MKNVFIYVLKDPVTEDIRYVGKANDLRHRFSNHLSQSRKEKNHRARWISSLLDRGLQPIIERIDEVPEDEWPYWEAAYILHFKELGFDLVNATLGGYGGPDNTGRKHSEESKRNRSLRVSGNSNPFFGKRHSFDTRKKIGEKSKGRKPNKGKKFSLEHREKLALAKTGIKRSDEAREKVSLGGKLRWEKYRQEKILGEMWR